jgi:parallel beta-helix repeat protein
MKGAVINANGGPYAVGIAHSNVTVEGLSVENAHLNNTTHAPGDGIITAGFVGGVPTASNDDVIVDNIAKNNQGAGIDLNSTTGSIAVDNLASGNGAGVNLSNDLGPASSHNFVSGNDATNNPGGCGIVLADHTGSGVFDNTIVGNFANDNGLGTPSRPNASSGSGVILASAGSKGGVYNNVIESNQMTGNGHGGVALHGHAKGAKFSGNQIIDNTIGTNNKRTDYKDKKTTAIYLGDASKLTIKVAGNVFMHDAIGVFSAGPVTVTGFGTNSFQAVNTKKQHIAKYAG